MNNEVVGGTGKMSDLDETDLDAVLGNIDGDEFNAYVLRDVGREEKLEFWHARFVCCGLSLFFWGGIARELFVAVSGNSLHALAGGQGQSTSHDCLLGAHVIAHPALQNFRHIDSTVLFSVTVTCDIRCTDSCPAAGPVSAACQGREGSKPKQLGRSGVLAISRWVS